MTLVLTLCSVLGASPSDAWPFWSEPPAEAQVTLDATQVLQALEERRPLAAEQLALAREHQPVLDAAWKQVQAGLAAKGCTVGRETAPLAPMTLARVVAVRAAASADVPGHARALVQLSHRLARCDKLDLITLSVALAVERQAAALVRWSVAQKPWPAKAKAELVQAWNAEAPDAKAFQRALDGELEIALGLMTTVTKHQPGGPAFDLGATQAALRLLFAELKASDFSDASVRALVQRAKQQVTDAERLALAKKGPPPDGGFAPNAAGRFVVATAFGGLPSPAQRTHHDLAARPSAASLFE